MYRFRAFGNPFGSRDYQIAPSMATETPPSEGAPEIPTIDPRQQLREDIRAILIGKTNRPLFMRNEAQSQEQPLFHSQSQNSNESSSSIQEHDRKGVFRVKLKQKKKDTLTLGGQFQYIQPTSTLFSTESKKKHQK